MSPADPEALRALLDEREIRRVLYRYCRGVDRMDRALTRSCWHADGTANYEGMFEGSADALLEWMWATHETMQAHSHQMTNMTIETSAAAAARAVSETYVTVVLRTKPRGDHPPRDILNRGRYLDRWTKREGHWAITHRHYLHDWMAYVPVSDAPTSPITGRRDETDPTYKAFAELHKP